MVFEVSMSISSYSVSFIEYSVSTYVEWYKDKCWKGKVKPL